MRTEDGYIVSGEHYQSGLFVHGPFGLWPAFIGALALVIQGKCNRVRLESSKDFRLRVTSPLKDD
jgi:hypothetical protein